jgi:hypothetical protein
MTIRESQVEKRLRTLVEAEGGLCKKWVCPGWDGAPDRIVILHGVTYFTEMKAPGRYPTALQRLRLDELRAAGALAGWLGSYEDVERFMTDRTMR